MKVDCFTFNEFAPKIVPARPHRKWMDSSSNRHAYRCLPLSIANAHGWELLCPVPIEVEWNGGTTAKDLSVRAMKPHPLGRPIGDFCRSHFAQGIVTFHVDYIFRTEPGWNLLASGSFNDPKENASPLTGIIETDWLPYPFTMNWKILRPGLVRFEEDEPFCMIFPILTTPLVECEIEIKPLSSQNDLSSEHDAFRASRKRFLQRINAGDETAIEEAWQKHYFVGQLPTGSRVERHINKLRLREPRDLRQASGTV